MVMIGERRKEIDVSALNEFSQWAVRSSGHGGCLSEQVTAWQRARQKLVRSSELLASLSEGASRTARSSEPSNGLANLDCVLGLVSAPDLGWFEVQTSPKHSVIRDGGNVDLKHIVLWNSNEIEGRYNMEITGKCS